MSRLCILALGLATLAGIGCESNVSQAKFCHNVTVDGQPALLRLVQMIPGGGERKFMARTGECSPCGPLKNDNTFRFELRTESGHVLFNRPLFVTVGYRNYVMLVASNPDGTIGFEAKPYPLLVACRNIPDPPKDGGTSSLISEDGEETEGPASLVPDDSSENPPE